MARQAVQTPRCPACGAGYPYPHPIVRGGALTGRWECASCGCLFGDTPPAGGSLTGPPAG